MDRVSKGFLKKYVSPVAQQLVFNNSLDANSLNISQRSSGETTPNPILKRCKTSSKTVGQTQVRDLAKSKTFKKQESKKSILATPQSREPSVTPAECDSGSSSSISQSLSQIESQGKGRNSWIMRRKDASFRADSEIKFHER